MSVRMSSAFGLAVLGLFSAGGLALAQHSHDAGHHMGSGHNESEPGHSHERAMVHGGQVTMTPHHHFEVLFADDQARVYLYDDKQNPITNPEDVEAAMTFMMKDGKAEAMDLSYMAPDPEKGRTQGYFYCDRDMSDVKDGNMKAVIRMMGLDDKPIEFRTPVALATLVTYVCPMKDSPPAEDPGSCPNCGMQMKMTENGAHMGTHGDHERDHNGEDHHQ